MWRVYCTFDLEILEKYSMVIFRSQQYWFLNILDVIDGEGVYRTYKTGRCLLSTLELEGKSVSLYNSHDNRVPGEFLFQPKCYPGKLAKLAGRSDVSYSRGVKLGQTVCQLSFNASTNQQSPSIGRGLRLQPIRTISRFVGQPMGGV